jgi:Cdc6-like AAA superfamily ATPase
LEKVQDFLKKNESNKISGHKALIIPPIPEEKLKDQSTAIITGVAGSGKSTILSRHYEHVKKNNSNVWVIKINLINHSKYLSELKIPASGSEEASTSTAIDILINFPGVTSQSEFARSLLKNRLKHSGGVVLMLDGFDEINFECQTNIICLMKALSNGKTKMDRLIITTRPHWTEKLQKALFQLPFSLEHLGKEHQVSISLITGKKR